MVSKPLFMDSVSIARPGSSVAEENWKLLYYLNFYRLVIATMATAVAIAPIEIPPFGSKSQALFIMASMIYLALTMGSLGAARSRMFGFENQATFLAFVDITVISLLTYASGGFDSGLALLLIVTVAAVSLVLDRRMTIFFASLGTVAVTVEHNWDFLIGGPLITEGYSQVAMLGVGLFATAGLSYMLATRLRATEELAAQRGIDLANLAQVNELIIKNMQSGVLVCDRIGQVRMINDPARNFLGFRQDIKKPPALADIFPDLAHQLTKWVSHRDNRARQVAESPTGYMLLPRFVPIGKEKDAGVLVFLQDTSVLRQQAQQLKMEALARLTASIAHEIRNPLGAISNAAQLLAETVPSQSQDQRLVRIINDQSHRMNAIVENVLQLSRRDHADPVRFDLHRWLLEFAPAYCDTNHLPVDAISVQGQSEVFVYVDPEQLFQVVVNLCQNALRHSPPFGNKAVIELGAGFDEQRRPFLEVTDWGTGIPANIVENIFDPFFTTTPKGTGLGLYISRELCEGNGACLQYHANEPAGARFRVTFAKTDE